MASLILRLVRPEEADLEALAALVNRAFAVYPFLTVARTSARGIAEEAGDSGEFLLAEADGELVGCAMIRPAAEGERVIERGGTEADRDAMYFGLAAVEPGLMRSGIGRRLVAFGESEAARRGFREVLLGTVREMGNVEYYQRAGYRTTAVLRFPANANHWGINIDHEYHEMVKQL